MILHLLILGTWPFWLALAVLFVIIVAAVERENEGWAIVFVIAGLALLAAFSDFNPFVWVYHHPLTLLAYLGLYAVGGTGWSAFKWTLFNYEKASEYDAQREKIKAGYEEYVKRVDSMNAAAHRPSDRQELRSFKDWVSAQHKYPPVLSQHKDKVIDWIVFWPFSAAWFFLHDPITRAARFIYNRMVAVYNAITGRAFSRFSELQ